MGTGELKDRPHLTIRKEVTRWHYFKCTFADRGGSAVYGVMTRHKKPLDLESASVCRAKAESFREIAARTTTAELKALALRQAEQWEKRAVWHGQD
jgi:hypothetical protein